MDGSRGDNRDQAYFKHLPTYLAQYPMRQELCFQKHIEAKELLSLSGSFCFRVFFKEINPFLKG